MTSVRGLAYPLQIRDGKLQLSEDGDIVEQQIISVLETRPFERVMRADYGLPDSTFETMMPAAVGSKISEAILGQVSGIGDLSVDVSWNNGDSGVYNVDIQYSVDGVPQPPLTLSLVV